MLVKRNKKKDEATMEHFLINFRECNGFMHLACLQAGVSKTDVNILRDIYPNFDTALNEYEEFRNELAANEMYRLAVEGRKAAKGDFKALEFWLQTKGAHLGFVKRKQIELEVTDKRLKISADEISSDPIEASRQYQELIT